MWLNRLVSKGENDTFCADYYYKEGNFLVCRQVSKPDEINVPIRKFSVFKDQDIFIKSLEKIDVDRCYYEVIKSHVKQKPYFDIDMSPENMKAAQIDPKDYKMVAESVINAILKVYPQIKRKSILVYNAHSKDVEKPKYSYHIIVYNWYVENAAENQYFFNKVMKELPKTFDKVVDCSLFKENQQFRILGSNKFNSVRVKKTDDLGKLSSKDPYFIIRSSLITYVEKSEKLDDPEFKNVRGRIKKDGSMCKSKIEFDHNDKKLLNIIRPFTKSFNVYPAPNGYHLRRIEPSECLICNRVHDNENASIEINDLGIMYYRCFRDISNTKFLASLDKYEMKPVEGQTAPVFKMEAKEQKVNKTFRSGKINNKGDQATLAFEALF